MRLRPVRILRTETGLTGTQLQMEYLYRKKGIYGIRQIIKSEKIRTIAFFAQDVCAAGRLQTSCDRIALPLPGAACLEELL